MPAFFLQYSRRVDKKVASLKKEMALFELRQALDMTQTELASELKMKQAAISRLQHPPSLAGTRQDVLSHHRKIK